MNVLIFHWCIHRFQWDFESFIGVFNHSYECFDYPLMYPVFPMMFLIIHRGIQPFLLIFGSSICCWCNESSESQPFIDSTKGPSVLLLSVCHQEKETFCTHLYRWPMQRNIFDSIICEPSDHFKFFCVPLLSAFNDETFSAWLKKRFRKFCDFNATSLLSSSKNMNCFCCQIPYH